MSFTIVKPKFNNPIKEKRIRSAIKKIYDAYCAAEYAVVLGVDDCHPNDRSRQDNYFATMNDVKDEDVSIIEWIINEYSNPVLEYYFNRKSFKEVTSDQRVAWYFLLKDLENLGIDNISEYIKTLEPLFTD